MTRPWADETEGALVVGDAETMRELGRRIAALLVPGDLLVLTGGLGAGKTTLTQGIGDGLGVRGPVVSPTFTMARVQPSTVGGPALVHVDAYRLGSLADLETLDLDESLEDSVTVVEWGAGWVETLAVDRLEVSITRPRGRPVEADEADAADGAAGSRLVRMVGVGERWERVALPDSA